MKRDSILLLISMTLSYGLISAQEKVPNKFIALTEAEVYKLYDQMLDSIKVSGGHVHQNANDYDYDFFSFIFFDNIDSKDTIMRVEQDFLSLGGRTYFAYISNCMPIAFYERFLDYLKEIGKKGKVVIIYQ